MADQSLQDWAKELKLPHELLLSTLVSAGWDESKNSVSDEEKKKYKRALIKAMLAAKKSAAAGTSFSPPAPASEVSQPPPAKPEPIERKPQEADKPPEAMGVQEKFRQVQAEQAAQQEQAQKAAIERERKLREEEAEKARIEAEERARETARKLEEEQQKEAPARTAAPAPAKGRFNAGKGAPKRRLTQRAPRRRRRSTDRSELELESLSTPGDGRPQQQQGDFEQGPLQARDVEVPEIVQISDLAHRMSVKASVVIKALLDLGVVTTATQSIDQDTAVLAVAEIGHNPIPVQDRAAEERLQNFLRQAVQDVELKPRPPVVTVMGHVDHGKTSLLDRIRQSKVADSEEGGITQHIGAYQALVGKSRITFIDTPGHAAFTALRARGAKVTDVAVLVVAADDGVMPQTEEAMEHAQAANVAIVVAINKMDRPQADPEQVKRQLAEKGLQVEGWGGDVQAVELSASTGEGVDKLLEAVLLEAEIRELKAPDQGPAEGIVLEASMQPGRGPAATLLVQSGTLKVGDILLVGSEEVRVRAMAGYDGGRLKEAGPSTPVEILGFATVPEVGLPFAAVKDSSLRKDVLEYRRRVEDNRKALKEKVALENLFDNRQSQHLQMVIKANVRGSLEAIQDALGRLGNDRISVQVVSGGIGAIGEGDINLAHATGGIVIGFNVRADALAKKAARQFDTEIRYYSTIYALIEDIEKAMLGMLEPELREEIIGTAEVKEVFNSSSFGMIAGSVVAEGVVRREEPVRVLRDNVVIFEGELSSLRRYKDKVDEVREGTECGIGIKDYKDVRVGDRIEVFSVRKIAATLQQSA